MSASAWDSVPAAPVDPILGINIAFNACNAVGKMNLGVGAYRDENLKPYVLKCVREAERRIVSQNLDKEYIPIDGLAAFKSAAASLILGKDCPALSEGRVASSQALSGTGALRIAGEFFKKYQASPASNFCYVSNPTWGNHNKLFAACGIEVREYRYYNKSNNTLDIDGFIQDILAMPNGSLIVLHACAHNPTGLDPTREQWIAIRDAIRSRGLVVLFDSAYQGYSSGSLDQDAWALRHFVEQGFEIIITQSFAKNMGMYGERVGAIHFVTSNAAAAANVLSQVKIIVRTNYSSPPCHGARVAAAVLNDPELYAMWTEELAGMAHRINTMRTALVAALQANGTPGTWTHISTQQGMFAFTGLHPIQVDALTSRHHVFLTRDGRISIAGLNDANVGKLADAIKNVVTDSSLSAAL